MKNFKKVMDTMNRTISTFCFGFSTTQLFIGNYQNAAWILFFVSIAFGIGYFAERLN